MWLWQAVQTVLVFWRWLLDQLIDMVFHLLYMGHKHVPLPPIADDTLLISATQVDPTALGFFGASFRGIMGRVVGNSDLELSTLTLCTCFDLQNIPHS